jgi:hypothetical protein
MVLRHVVWWKFTDSSEALFAGLITYFCSGLHNFFIQIHKINNRRLYAELDPPLTSRNCVRVLLFAYSTPDGECSAGCLSVHEDCFAFRSSQDLDKRNVMQWASVY